MYSFSGQVRGPGHIGSGRRHKLYGVMKRAKHEGRHVSFVRDKLYIDGELHVLPDNRKELPGHIGSGQLLVEHRFAISL
jgi:hypothetical protein